MFNFTRGQQRVTEILNACAAGTISSTLSSRNKTRNATAIEYAGYEAGLIVLQAIGSTPNEFRSLLVGSPVTVTHGDLLPEHLGNPVSVEIQRYSGAPWREAERRDWQKIESYRVNEENTFDPINHNEEGSDLSGYFDFWEKKIYFTGYACRVKLATAARADVLTKIPDVLEPVVIKLWVGNCPKAGEGLITMEIARWYETKGDRDLQEFKNGKRQFAEVSSNQPMSEVHQ